MKVLVKKCEQFKPLIGTWQEVSRDYDEDEGSREAYRVTSVDSPIFLFRDEFQLEAEVKAKDYVLNYFEQNKAFPNHVMYKGEKRDSKFKLVREELFVGNHYCTLIDYRSGWGELTFRVRVMIHLDDKLKPAITFKNLSYLGMSHFSIPEPKEYYTE